MPSPVLASCACPPMLQRRQRSRMLRLAAPRRRTGWAIPWPTGLLAPRLTAELHPKMHQHGCRPAEGPAATRARLQRVPPQTVPHKDPPPRVLRTPRAKTLPMPRSPPLRVLRPTHSSLVPPKSPPPRVLHQFLGMPLRCHATQLSLHFCRARRGSAGGSHGGFGGSGAHTRHVGGHQVRNLRQPRSA